MMTDAELKKELKKIYLAEPEKTKLILGSLEARDEVNAIDPNNPKATYGLWLNERNAYEARRRIRLLREIIQEEQI